MSLSAVHRRCFVTEKKPAVEFLGTLGDVRPRQDAEAMVCAASPAGIDPCSSAGLD
jgi:hypothetical protein